ncbi:MAG: hypothetical protein COC17_06035 [Hyphomicrobiales bacterium]|nr:MAG: hypothetical protein COC17_06035 [Hyphomicrobiales bacterium]
MLFLKGIKKLATYINSTTKIFCFALCFTLWAMLTGILVSTTSFAQSKNTSPTLRITFKAMLIKDGPPIVNGIEWRIFSTNIGEDGKFPLLAKSADSNSSFNMSPGVYMVHAAYGHASAIRKIEISKDDVSEPFIFNAGGLSLSAVAGENIPIPKSLLRFDIYEQKIDNRGNRRLIARSVLPNKIIPFPAGTYHVVSKFGMLNAEVRADLRVRAGKVTNGELVHRAARITLRLVRETGSDALANTRWSVFNESGDLISESTSAFPNIVLSEGSYSAIAKNDDTIYSLDFLVKAGLDQDVEVIAQ